ncbi:MAG: hypothetical protein FWD89_03440 [Firmicutes bacterium]|nr:hypothetical protein [Bacillota bacterium]MCL2771343.1 hypothetical protein [Bacillota bacterium]
MEKKQQDTVEILLALRDKILEIVDENADKNIILCVKEALYEFRREILDSEKPLRIINGLPKIFNASFNETWDPNSLWGEKLTQVNPEAKRFLRGLTEKVKTGDPNNVSEYATFVAISTLKTHLGKLYQKGQFKSKKAMKYKAELKTNYERRDSILKDKLAVEIYY